MALREDDHVAGGHLDLVFAQHADEAASLGEDVVRDEVVGARHDARRQLAISSRAAERLDVGLTPSP
jgi:hypothetical protein